MKLNSAKVKGRLDPFFMEIARELKNKGVTCPDGLTVKPRIDFLGLYDAVDMVLGYGEDETTPSNVNYGAHAMGRKKLDQGLTLILLIMAQKMLVQ